MPGGLWGEEVTTMLPQVYHLVPELLNLWKSVFTIIVELNHVQFVCTRTNHQKYLREGPNLFKTAPFRSNTEHLIFCISTDLQSYWVVRKYVKTITSLHRYIYCFILHHSIPVDVLSYWTALLVSVWWPTSWQTRCLPVDGCGRCKRPHWTHLRQCGGLCPSWRCSRGWRSGSARHLYTSWRNNTGKKREEWYWCGLRRSVGPLPLLRLENM